MIAASRWLFDSVNAVKRFERDSDRCTASTSLADFRPGRRLYSRCLRAIRLSDRESSLSLAWRGALLEDELEHVLCRKVEDGLRDRKSTRLNSSHSQISYAVFC